MNKWLVILFLLTINVVTIISGFKHASKEEEPAEENIVVPLGQRVNFFRDQLGLTQEQRSLFMEAARNFNQEAVRITGNIKTARFGMYDEMAKSESDPEILDAGGEAGYPWMTNYNQTLYLVWERNDGTQVVPVWNAYTEGSWGTPQPIDILPDSDAWYPVVNSGSSGVEIAWSSRSSDCASIETFLIQSDNLNLEDVDGDLNGDGDVDKDDRTILTDSFWSRAGDSNFMSEADYDHDGRITFRDYRKWYQYYKDFINQ